MTNWTLNGQTFESARVLNARRSLRTGGGDTCQVELAWDGGGVGYSHGQSINIYADGVLWFRGLAFRPQAVQTSRGGRIHLEVRSLWWLLEQCTLTSEYQSLDKQSGGIEDTSTSISANGVGSGGANGVGPTYGAASGPGSYGGANFNGASNGAGVNVGPSYGAHGVPSYGGSGASVGASYGSYGNPNGLTYGPGGAAAGRVYGGGYNAAGEPLSSAGAAGSPPTYGAGLAGGEDAEAGTPNFHTAVKSRLQLNTDATGTRLTTAQCFTSIIDHCNDLAPVQITLGSVLTGIHFPLTEVLDQKCSEPLLGTLMRWHPNSVIYFDYPANGALCWKKTNQLGNLSISPNQSSRCKVLSAGSCPDLVPDGVVIHYEKTTSIDGKSYSEIVDDVAGAANAFRTIHFTVPLHGGSVTTQQQQIKTTNLPTDGESVAAKRWLKLKHPSLANVGDHDLQIKQFTQTVNESESDKRNLPKRFHRELTLGQIQPWMEARLGIKSGRVVVSATVRYDGSDREVAAQFAPTGSRVFQVEVLGTTAKSGLYTTADKSLDLADQEEPLITGLAAAYYSALTTLQGQGEIELNEESCDPYICVGRKITLNGITSIIQSVDQDARGGTTRIGFGPHQGGLTPGDFLELQRAFLRKTRQSHDHRQARGDAQKAVKGKAVEGAVKVASNNQLHVAPPEPREFFRCRLAGRGQVAVERGIVYGTKWNDEKDEPKPEHALKATQVSATGGLGVSAGDGLYVEITLTEGHYEPEGEFSEFDDIDLTWSGTAQGAWSGTVNLDDVTARVTNGNVVGSITPGALTFDSLDIDPGLFNLTATTIADGIATGDPPPEVPPIDPNNPPPSCPCAPLTGEFEGGFLRAEDINGGDVFHTEIDSGEGFSLMPSGSMGSLTWSLALEDTEVEIEDASFTVTGSMSLTVTGSVAPSSLRVPKKVKLKVLHWDVSGATVVKKSTEPSSTETKAYVKIAEVEDDGSGGVKVVQCHLGAILLSGLIAVKIAKDD